MLVTTLLRCSGEGVPRTARRVLPGPTVHPGRARARGALPGAGLSTELRRRRLQWPRGHGCSWGKGHVPSPPGQNVALQGQAAAFPSRLLALPLLWR